MRKKQIIMMWILCMCIVWQGKLLSQPENILVDACVDNSGDDATYLKNYIVKLDAAGTGQKMQIAKYSMILKKNTIYRFSVCETENSGQGIIKLYDTHEKVGGNVVESSGEVFKAFDFVCKKTGVYHLIVSFKGGKAGKAVVVFSFVDKI